MATTKNPLPDNIEPSGDMLCIPVFIPNESDWLWLLAHAVSLPTLQRFWINDTSGQRDIMRKNWESLVYLPLVEKIIAGEGCSGDGGLTCFDLFPQSSAFEYFPNDPYLDGDNSDGYPVVSQMRWGLWGSVNSDTIPHLTDALNQYLQNFTGYFPTDVMLVPDIDEVFLNPIDRLGQLVGTFTQAPLPYIKITVQGAVEVEIDLLKVPFGGSVIIIPDMELSASVLWETIQEIFDNDGDIPNFWQLTEINRDIFGVPPELDVVLKKEVKFDTDETHTIHIIFVPRFNDEIPFYFPFGGIRKIEICGGGAVVPETETIIDTINYGDEIFVRDGVITVSTVEDICNGVICALEKSASRFLSGQAGNVVGGVTIGTDGTVTIGGENDSVGNFGNKTFLESHAGGVTSVQLSLFSMFQDIEDWRDQYSTAIVKQFVKSKYQVTGDIDAVIDSIETRIPAPALWFVATTGLDGDLFCKGVNKNQISAHFIDYTGIPENQLLNMLEVVSAIEPAQITEWYNAGLDTPLSNYDGYPCVLKQSSQIEVTWGEWVAKSTQVVNPVGWNFTGQSRALRVELTGNYTGDGGAIQDFFWYKSGTGATPVVINDFLVPYGNMAIFSGGANPTAYLRPAVTPAFNPTGEYSYTVVVTNINVVNWQVKNNVNARLTNGAGEIIMKVSDLGAIE